MKRIYKLLIVLSGVLFINDADTQWQTVYFNSLVSPPTFPFYTAEFCNFNNGFGVGEGQIYTGEILRTTDKSY